MGLTKEECINKVFLLQSKTNGSITIDMLKDCGIYYDILKYWKNTTELKNDLGLIKKQTFDGKTFSEEELIQILKDFQQQYGFFPTSQFVEEHGKEYGLPNRKTFNNKIGSWNIIKKKCGIDTGNYVVNDDDSITLIYDNKDFLIDVIFNYMEDNNGEIPTIRKMNDYYGMELKKYYKKHFGGWNNCLKQLGLKLNSISQYTDKELECAFLDFVNKHDRVPTIQDFNKTGRPSFWVYQNRFGSWAQACIHYGYKPNCREIKFYMDDGEVCDSSFEYDISVWLKSKHIPYERNVKYSDIDNEYKGKMNCDYVFTLSNGDKWYVEMAGFIDTYDFKKIKNRPEQLYFFKLMYKKKLLKRSQVNYKFITPSDMKNKTMEEIFDFLIKDFDIRKEVI